MRRDGTHGTHRPHAAQVPRGPHDPHDPLSGPACVPHDPVERRGPGWTYATGSGRGSRLHRCVRAVARACCAIALVAATGLAAAQSTVCRDALDAAAQSADGAPARVATAVARAAYEALEPAFPHRGSSRDWDDVNAAWLDRRGWLPQSWSEDELDPAAWAALLAGLQEPYGREPRSVSGERDAGTLVREAAEALAAGADAVRPLALVATDGEDRGAVTFVSVLWNWTPYPRLLLFDVDDASVDEEGRPAGVLDRIGSCAWRPNVWLSTTEDAAADYYFGNVEAGLRLIATDRGPIGRDVPRGEEREVLRYAWEGMNGSVASVTFTGPGPGLSQVVGLLGSVRTNLGVFELNHYLAFP